MLENKKLLTSVIGYIIGIIMGLYCKISIALFYLIMYFIYLIICSKQENIKLNTFKRYVKKVVNKKNIIIIIVFSIIANSIVLFQNYKYKNTYKSFYEKDINISGIIVEKDNNKYKLKVTTPQYKNTYLYVYYQNEKNDIQYGDKVIIKGKFLKPNISKNFNDFNYNNYLKTMKIYGRINANIIEVKSKNNINPIFSLANKTKNNIIKIIESSKLQDEEKEILKALIIGKKDEMENYLKEEFSKANISHILAISGMHISYIILFTEFIFNNIVGKHYSKILTSISVLIYIIIIGFVPTVVRAGVSGIIVEMSAFLYRRNNIVETISLSLLIILMYNPFLLLNIGLQLSFLGTIRNCYLCTNTETNYIKKHNKN